MIKAGRRWWTYSQGDHICVRIARDTGRRVNRGFSREEAEAIGRQVYHVMPSFCLFAEYTYRAVYLGGEKFYVRVSPKGIELPVLEDGKPARTLDKKLIPDFLEPRA